MSVGLVIRILCVLRWISLGGCCILLVVLGHVRVSVGIASVVCAL